MILNRYPYTNGHVMVAPLAHEAWLSDSDPETLAELIATVARAQKILVAAYRTDGLNVGINFGSAAGAGVAGPLPRARRAALGGRHELHDGDRGTSASSPRSSTTTRRRLRPLFAEAA